MKLQFTKMHGIGNDFVVVDCLCAGAPSTDVLHRHARHLCDRKFGIGADGVIAVMRSESADFRMRMFNPDGSEAEMCGNGIRCFANFVYDRGYTSRTEISVDTGAGRLLLSLTLSGDHADRVKVDMGPPYLERSEIPMLGGPGIAVAQPVTVDGEAVTVTAVSMGNPHAVLFANSVDEITINRLGPRLERHDLFPRRINVHLVEVISPREIRMLTWERGAGRTLACGTGACACAVAANLNGMTGRRVLVHLAGGDLEIDWSTEDGHVYMTGPAEEVFTGEIVLPDG